MGAKQVPDLHLARTPDNLLVNGFLAQIREQPVDRLAGESGGNLPTASNRTKEGNGKGEVVNGLGMADLSFSQKENALEVK